MKNLVNELLSTIAGIGQYPITVKSFRRANSKLAPVFPMIVVGQVVNTARLTIKQEERLSNVVYQVDIFCKDAVMGGKPTAGVDICDAIAEVVDATLNETYGLTRVMAIDIPDVNDATVSRLTLRYSGILDTKTDYIYR